MLDDDTIAFIQAGVSISLAACGPDRLASMSRGFGCKVLDGGKRVGIFVRRSQSAELIDAIRWSGKVANVFSLPSTNRTVQLKGVGAQVTPFDPADLPVVEAHIAEFVREVVALGLAANVVRALFSFPPGDLVTVVYSPSDAFSQTPGPRAGEPLGAAR